MIDIKQYLLALNSNGFINFLMTLILLLGKRKKICASKVINFFYFAI